MSHPSDKKAELSLVGAAKTPIPDKLERPLFAVYEEITYVEGKQYKPGTWYHGVKQNGPEEKAIPVDHWICAPLHVEA